MARITVVNNYPDFVELMTSLLDETAGHDVTGIDAAEATPDDLMQTRPDLLIVDLETADAVLGTGELRDGDTATSLGLVPTIVCSGDVPALRERAEEFGDLSNVYPLEKPFALDVLVDLVELALFKAALSPTA